MVLGGLFWLALLGWGIIKYASLAYEPAVNARCARSLAIALGAWALVSLTNTARVVSGGVISPEGNLAVMVVGFGALALCVVAVVFAILGLRELSRETVPGELDLRRGRGLATSALVASGLMLVLFLGGVAFGIARGMTAHAPRPPLTRPHN